MTGLIHVLLRLLETSPRKPLGKTHSSSPAPDPECSMSKANEDAELRTLRYKKLHSSQSNPFLFPQVVGLPSMCSAMTHFPT